MGFFKQLLHTAGIFLETAVYAAGTLAAYVGDKAGKLARVAKQAYHDYKSRNIPQEKRDNRSTLGQVNGLISDLEAKRRRNGGLSHYDAHDLNNLYSRRKSLIDEALEFHEMETAKDIAENQGDFDDVEVHENNIHIVQFHVGQAVSNKRCPACQKPMQLQWQRGTLKAGFNDLFWGCTGFYDDSCHKTLRFMSQDAYLFTKTTRPEFQISAGQLNNIVMKPSSQIIIKKRINDLRDEVVEKYLCPVHGVELVLKQKNGAEGLLDLYFLGCPMWNGTDSGCNFVMKLKSAAQLASLLEATTGRGLL